MIGIDLFAGAGGLSLGACMAGIRVKYAIERDPHAVATYKKNHPTTCVLQKDVRRISAKADFGAMGATDLVLFGGAPCQGFSTSNQRTRTKKNKQNWLFQPFLSLARAIKPEWVVFENVKGISETEDGFFLDQVTTGLKDAGYTVTKWLLNSSNFGVPQHRSRWFIIGSKSGVIPSAPAPYKLKLSVKDAIGDLPILRNGASACAKQYRLDANSAYAKTMRGKMKSCCNHLVTRSNQVVIRRYTCVPAGGNWQDIPKTLMKNYADRSRCHIHIYHRLRYEKPSVVIGNFRKNMLIHPTQNRGLSVREAARLQSFPDSYTFTGSIGFQQQQVGNAVPPLLAKAVFEQIVKSSKK
jgi:DNA (cytosine-5)-methyltransferase 1